ncbi:MAG: hypothetical protein HYW93_04730, partial [Thaumarchaeota archaeon]|nr:hypothetical protein [Nitrososphaerota archaeon]
MRKGRQMDNMKGYQEGGRFGKYGGQFIPETLMPAVQELEKAYVSISKENAFRKELDHYL